MIVLSYAYFQNRLNKNMFSASNKGSATPPLFCSAPLEIRHCYCCTQTRLIMKYKPWLSSETNDYKTQQAAKREWYYSETHSNRTQHWNDWPFLDCSRLRQLDRPGWYSPDIHMNVHNKYMYKLIVCTVQLCVSLLRECLENKFHWRQNNPAEDKRHARTNM